MYITNNTPKTINTGRNAITAKNKIIPSTNPHKISIIMFSILQIQMVDKLLCNPHS